jgi:hypothetical protein
VACLLLIALCNGGCAATTGPQQPGVVTFAYLMLAPFAGWATVPDSDLRVAWPFLLFATLMTAVPLAIYLWTETAPPGALGWAALNWLAWGYFFTIAIWF